MAISLIDTYGTPMAKALSRLRGQNARRLAILEHHGLWQKVPYRERILDVIARYGDPAADWVWRNRDAILAPGVAAAFVTSPEKFINPLSSMKLGK